MKITWLGQAGLLFEIEDKTIVIDPYLSDSVAKEKLLKLIMFLFPALDKYSKRRN